VKEVISVRVERELLRKLGLEEGNKSEGVRKILEEYLKLKEEVERLREVEKRIFSLEESLRKVGKQTEFVAGKVSGIDRKFRKAVREVLEKEETCLWRGFLGSLIALFLLLVLKEGFPFLVELLKK